MNNLSSLDQGCPCVATLHAIGEQTLYRLSQSVPMSSTLVDAVLQVRGTNKPHAPRLQSPDERALRSFWQECDALVHHNMVTQWVQEACEKGWICQTRHGLALTASGLVHAVAARAHFSPQNVTAFWIGKTLTREVLHSLTQHLRHKLSRSVAFNEIQDLVHGYLVNLIRRDGLRARLAEGRQPSPANLRAWTYKAALSQFRDEGRDAHTRSFKGSKTEKDLRLGYDEMASKSMPSDNQAIFMGLDDDGQESTLVSSNASSNPLLDIAGGNLEDEVLHKMRAQEGLALMQAAMQQEKANASERFSRLARMVMVDGLSTPEIASVEGVSRTRATVLMNEFRGALDRAAATSAIAYQVLAYLQEEPCSTLMDLQEDCKDVTSLLMDDLVRSGRVQRVGRGGFILAPSGTCALESGETFGVHYAR